MRTHGAGVVVGASLTGVEPRSQPGQRNRRAAPATGPKAFQRVLAGGADQSHPCWHRRRLTPAFSAESAGGIALQAAQQIRRPVPAYGRRRAACSLKPWAAPVHGVLGVICAGISGRSVLPASAARSRDLVRHGSGAPAHLPCPACSAGQNRSLILAADPGGSAGHALYPVSWRSDLNRHHLRPSTLRIASPPGLNAFRVSIGKTTAVDPLAVDGNAVASSYEKAIGLFRRGASQNADLAGNAFHRPSPRKACGVVDHRVAVS